MPILFSIGPVSLFSLSLFIILAWVVFSFMFWRQLSDYGVQEAKVYDLMFYGTLIAFVCARAVYVVLNWSQFSENILKIITIWLVPGLSFYGGLIGAVIFMMIYAKTNKVRVSFILDALAVSLPAGMIMGNIGSFLDGTVVGKVTKLPWAVNYIGHTGYRHPVQLYNLVLLLLVYSAVILIRQKGDQKKWPYGISGIWFFFLSGITAFFIEFLTESGLYFIGLRVNQWVLIAIIGQALGSLYVFGGGRQLVVPKLRILKNSIKNLFKKGKDVTNQP